MRTLSTGSLVEVKATGSGDARLSSFRVAIYSIYLDHGFGGTTSCPRFASWRLNQESSAYSLSTLRRAPRTRTESLRWRKHPYMLENCIIVKLSGKPGLTESLLDRFPLQGLPKRPVQKPERVRRLRNLRRGCSSAP